MEMKASGSGEAVAGASAGCKKRPPSRLQKHAPASLQLEQGAGASPGPAAWGDGRAPIPLLSPLVMTPMATPVWEADQAGAARREGPGGGDQAEGRSGAEQQQQQQQRGPVWHGGNAGRQAHDASAKTPAPAPLPPASAGWRHPALPTPVAEPASLVPLFQSQCAVEVEVRNAQQ